jgi:nucleotide-binding universal stress UspA family protein
MNAIRRVRSSDMSRTAGFFFPPRKILVPLDFSDSSYAALAAASEYGEKFHAEIEVLHVIPTTPDFNGSDFFPSTSRLQEIRSEVAATLDSDTNALKSKGIRTSSSIEVGNEVAESIIMVARRDSIDMIIISTHGMSGWRPLMFGSIAAKVLKRVQCSLLLLPTVEPVSSDL